MKFKLPKRRLWRVAIYIVSTLLILLAIDLIAVQIGRHIPHDYATTRVTGPLLDDGRIDFLTVIEQHFSAGVTPENNAFPLFLEVIGRKGLPSNQPPDGITTRLGMPPLPETGDYFKTEIANIEPTLDIGPLLKHPWTAADYPRFAAWLAANERPLAKLRDASKRPRYFVPYNGGTRPELLGEILLPHLDPLHEMGRTLVWRAMLKAGSNDFAGARDDLQTAHDVARLVGQGATLIDRLVSFAIDITASDAEAALAAGGRLDAAQARQWLSALHELAPIASLSEPIDNGERYFSLDILQYTSRNGLQRIASILADGRINNSLTNTFAWSLAPVRIARSMQICNEFFDQVAVVAAKPAGPERQQALDALNSKFDYQRQINAWTIIAHPDWPVSVLGDRQKLFDRADVTQTHRNLASLAMVLAIYKAEHASYPPTLDALAIPDFAPPTDLFGGKPLVYRPKADSYLLYSIGPNRFDDAGKGDDIAVRADAPMTTPKPVKP